MQRQGSLDVRPHPRVVQARGRNLNRGLLCIEKALLEFYPASGALNSGLNAHSQTVMKRFAFHPELFVYRAAVLTTLAEQGFEWFTHYGAIDLIHDLYGLEVCAIHHEEDARQIEAVLRQMFPYWLYCVTYYEDTNLLEIGWKVKITRDIDRPRSQN